MISLTYLLVCLLVLAGPLGPTACIAVGDFHSLALTAGGVLLSWGYGLEGQMGNGGTLNNKVAEMK